MTTPRHQKKYPPYCLMQWRLPCLRPRTNASLKKQCQSFPLQHLKTQCSHLATG